ncbi:MAG: CYTH domain-containing protein [Holophagales bacterium]|nr:CYTH domain-containing protein [Holophagales bacterium]
MKFRVEGRELLEERLRALGATHGEVENEVNLLLDDDETSLRLGGRALRVRTVDGVGLLTFKGPASFEGGVKSRLELESCVDDPGAVLALLEALGYRPRFRYEKRRTTWRFEDPSRPLVVVDETPLGLFAEIEGGARSHLHAGGRAGRRRERLPPRLLLGSLAGGSRGRPGPSPRHALPAMKALVPAAGFGTRFRPATLTTPKPLLPLLGVPILVRLFRHLGSEGVTSAVVNAHHLAEALMAAVGDSCEGIPVAWSPEEPILGTAGAIRRAAERGLLGDEPFLVVNGDVFTTLPFAPLRAAFAAPGVVAALGVLPHAVPGETALWGDAAGRLVSLGNERPFAGATGPWLFTGLQLASPALVARIPPGVSELARDVLRPSTQKRDGAFALVPYRVPGDGLWFDLGSPARLEAAEAAIAASGLA